MIQPAEIKRMTPRDVGILWELASQNYTEITDHRGKTKTLRIEGMTSCNVWHEEDGTPFVIVGNKRLYYEESYHD